MDIICSSAMCSVMKTFYTADGDRDTKDSLLKFVAQVRIGEIHCVHNFLCPNSLRLMRSMDP